MPPKVDAIGDEIDNTVNIQPVTVNAVKITKLLEFATGEPEIWFDQVDALFAVNGITSETSKFQNVFAYGSAAILPYVHAVNKDATPLADNKTKYG